MQWFPGEGGKGPIRAQLPLEETHSLQGGERQLGEADMKTQGYSQLRQQWGPGGHQGLWEFREGPEAFPIPSKGL